MSDHNQKIEQAIEDVQSGKFSSFRQAAFSQNVSHSSVSYRVQGRPTRAEIHHPQSRLSKQQEDLLLRWTGDLQRQGLSPNHATLRAIVIAMLAENGDERPLGKHWAERFLKRHKILQTGRSTVTEISRVTALDEDLIREFFDRVKSEIDEYDLDPEDITNMDEKGFQMG
jgi:hypothetical protein